MNDESSPLFARLRSAFSLGRNWRRLVAPPDDHLRPLDGFRALSILWVTVFHAAWYTAPHIPLPTYAGLVLSPWMVPIWRGDFGVDIFFVLSGFLIAGMLIDERQRSGRIRLGLFYLRRLMRLWPTLCVAAVGEVLLIGDNSSMIWANLLYVNNFVPILQAAMGWTWSLAIEEQFYLVCPWLVRALGPFRDRVRLPIIAALICALVFIATRVVMRGRFHAVDSEIVVNRSFLRWTVGYDQLYVKPWMRAGPLLLGVAAAYLYRMPGFMTGIARRKYTASALLLVALVVSALSTHWPLFEHTRRWIEFDYLASFRTVFGGCVAYVLLLSLSDHPIGRRIGWLLSARWLYPIGQLAYSAYLVNPIVCTLIHHATAPLVWRGEASPMQLFLPLDIIGTFFVALVLHLSVERPWMNLRPRASE